MQQDRISVVPHLQNPVPVMSRTPSDCNISCRRRTRIWLKIGMTNSILVTSYLREMRLSLEASTSTGGKTHHHNQKRTRTITGQSRLPSVPRDEPLYDIGGCTVSFTMTKKILSKFFLFRIYTFLKQTYDTIRDSRIYPQMPYTLFLHHCTVYPNSVFLDRMREQGEKSFDYSERCQGMIQVEVEVEGAKYLVPEIIQEYIRNVGKIITSTGVNIFLNVPPITIPWGLEPAEDEESEERLRSLSILPTLDHTL